MIVLTPGRVYEITGPNKSLSQNPPRGGDYSGEAMFVRREKIRSSDWYVFATTDEQGDLERVRVPSGSVELEGDKIKAKEVIQKVILWRRWDPGRRQSVNDFIDEAKRIADETPDIEIPGLQKAIVEASTS